MLILFGWVNIYAATYDPEAASLLSLQTRSGMQLVWIGAALLSCILILFVINPRIYQALSLWLYIAVCIMLVAVLIFGREINGSKSWLMIGGLGIQPSEFSKLASALLLSSVMSRYGFRLNNRKDFMSAALVVLIPVMLIALEPDVGTILVYCSLAFMFYREGLSGWLLVAVGMAVLLFLLTLKFSPFVSILVAVALGGIYHTILSKKRLKTMLCHIAYIAALSFLPMSMNAVELPEELKEHPEYLLTAISAIPSTILLIRAIKRKERYLKLIILSFIGAVMLVFSVDFIFDNILKEHHRDRIENLLGITNDLQGAGYNVNQSKIAIGSGGLTGKGFLQGTQTKFNFVPEQSTDFIFCTIGEEWGFIGSLGVLLTFMVMIVTLIVSAERQKERFTRILGYCTASYLFMHVFVNIGMTIGIMPVVGIPLPFISYGGSSFMTFTILLFIYIRFDLNRWQ